MAVLDEDVALEEIARINSSPRHKSEIGHCGYYAALGSTIRIGKFLESGNPTTVSNSDSAICC